MSCLVFHFCFCFMKTFASIHIFCKFLNLYFFCFSFLEIINSRLLSNQAFLLVIYYLIILFFLWFLQSVIDSFTSISRKLKFICLNVAFDCNNYELIFLYSIDIFFLKKKKIQLQLSFLISVYFETSRLCYWGLFVFS